MAVLLLTTGALHFIAPVGFDKIVPPILPLDARFWTYLSGVAELVIALMLFAPIDQYKIRGYSLRFLGARAALLLFIAVFPANIYMAIDWSDRKMPEPLIAYARIALQFGLFYWSIALARKIKKFAPQDLTRTTRISTSRSMKAHSGVALSWSSKRSNLAVSALAKSNQVRKSNGSASPKSRQ